MHLTNGHTALEVQQAMITVMSRLPATLRPTPDLGPGHGNGQPRPDRSHYAVISGVATVYGSRSARIPALDQMREARIHLGQGYPLGPGLLIRRLCTDKLR